MSDAADHWFAVRCLFDVGWPPEAVGRTYEERITLWRAPTAEAAIGLAEAEAREHAAVITESPSSYLGLAQSYGFDGPPGDGVEVFSLTRDSDLPAKEYLDRFFDTGAEYQTPLSQES